MNKALAKIPSFSDEFGKMLQAMKKNKSKNLMPTYEDYKHYNFDKNTELLFLLDYIKNQE